MSTEDRDTSITEAAGAREEIQVYADGSAINGKVGAAAILIRGSKPIRTLHLHLGPESEHTVHEAEIAGILLGLQLIKTEKKTNTSCLIGVDNQAALKALQSVSRSPGQHIAREATRLANQLQRRKGKPKYTLAIRWTAGHEGIAGNELADKEAKEAANGKTSDKHLLPSYLRNTLQVNPSTVKHAHLDDLKRKWVETWRSSSRGKRISRIDESAPSAKFINMVSNAEISRQTASHISQMWIGHIPTNQYLKRIGRADSTRCPACGAEEETLEHYVLTCPNHAHERWALAKQASELNKHLSLKTLLSEKDMTIALAKYIAATHRFNKNGK